MASVKKQQHCYMFAVERFLFRTFSIFTQPSNPQSGDIKFCVTLFNLLVFEMLKVLFTRLTHHFLFRYTRFMLEMGTNAILIQILNDFHIWIGLMFSLHLYTVKKIKHNLNFSPYDIMLSAKFFSTIFS